MKRSLIKKVFITTVTAAAVLGATVFSSSAAEYVSVTKDGVNLRSGPGTNYEAIYQLPVHYPVRVLSKKGQWMKIEDYEGDKGWIYDTLVSASPYVIVKVKEGNVRSGPGTNNAKVGTVSKDVILKKGNRQGDWVQVSHPEIKGWVHRTLVWP